MKKDVKWILLIFFVTVIILFPLFYNDRLYGHDTIFHSGNIIYLSKTISMANLLGDRIIKLNTNPFGYGTWLFYPKLPHLLGAYVYLVVKNVYLSMNIIYFVTTFLSGFIMFYLSLKMFHNKRVAFLSSVIYLTYSYHICEIYIRDAYAENFMFMVIPLVFLGLYELKDNNINNFYIFFILGYVIGMYSHLISMLFCTIFVILFLIYYRKVFFVREKIEKFVISTIIVTCVSFPYIISILEHKIFGDYVVFTDDFFSKYYTKNHIVPIYRFIENSKTAIPNYIFVYINYTVIILIVVTTLFYFFKKNRKKYLDERKLFVFSFLILISFISSVWLWEHLPDMFSSIQFPWRLVTFFSVVISLYAPLIFLFDFKYLKLLYVITVLFVLIEGVNNIYYYGKEEYSSKEIVDSLSVMGWQMEYIPVSTRLYYHFDILSFESDDFKSINLNDDFKVEVIDEHFPSLKFKIDGLEKQVKIMIPRVYYLGYELVDEKDNRYSLYEASNGLLESTINRDGIYTLYYRGTIWDIISRVIRKITLVIVILVGGFRLWRM